MEAKRSVLSALAFVLSTPFGGLAQPAEKQSSPAPPAIPTFAETQMVRREIVAASEAPFVSSKVFSDGTRVAVADLGIVISLLSISIGRPPLISAGETGSSEDYTLIGYAVTNRSTAKKAQYTRPNRFLATNNARLSDEHKNTYKWIEFPPGTKLKGRPDADNGSIYPGADLRDLIAFETPVGVAHLLTFSIPLAVFVAGDKRRASFHIGVEGMLTELKARRDTFFSFRETGIPGVRWRMSPADVARMFPGLKRNDPPRWSGALPIEEWYTLEGQVAGGASTNISAWFFAGELYKLDIHSPAASPQRWIEMAKPLLGEPADYHGSPVWNIGQCSLMVADDRHGGTLASAWYAPLQAKEPEHGR